MRKTIYIIIILLICQTSRSQNIGVEKTMYSTQIGFLGFWVNNEYRLFNQISIKSEIGMVAGFKGCSDCTTEYTLAPELTIEPRWYYNIEKRNSKGKITKNNNANFIAIGTNYYPDWFVISNNSSAYVPNQIAIIPKWGIKRSIINSNFNYELGIGIGQKYYFDSHQWDTTADLVARIGYTF
ncbi:hypothetical protein CLU81_2459 [Flavobacterium sp. 9]|uniref:hypothetical protein n=1 Tax=Flavobacterium sp. 9 TaxID=2035198 RepID=UPI000C17DCB4|nr:hypothetical protein [Flavobacterium sp. 9]PIF31948.1 hypothetical protein CLU81_2459 [Flavobacterium sp. 9]